jgi:hypothetical protein
MAILPRLTLLAVGLIACPAASHSCIRRPDAVGSSAHFKVL